MGAAMAVIYRSNKRVNVRQNGKSAHNLGER